MQFLKMLKIGDVLILVSAIVMIFIAYAILPKAILLDDKRSLSIIVDHQLRSIDYTVSDKETYELQLEGGVALLEVNEGRVRILPMNVEICPNQICSKTGWIEASTQSIVCLPNRLVVTIVSPIKPVVDGVSF